VNAHPDGGPRLPGAPYLPHEYDAVLLDAVWPGGPSLTHARSTVRAGTPFNDATGGWPDWLAIELLAQLVAACAGLREYRPGVRPRLGLLLGVREYRVLRPGFAPGEQLDLTVHESSRDEDGSGVYDGELRIAGRLAASAILTVFLPADVEAYLQGNEE
jgi:predicted hotdog family 3-hydroxylacyl-ACP dehydratase